MWVCYIKTFDYVFKDNGGIGSFLTDKNQPEVLRPIIKDGELVEVIYYPYIFRFIFDNLAMWILRVIGINIFAGIIIDTFGSLKDKSQ